MVAEERVEVVGVEEEEEEEWVDSRQDLEGLACVHAAGTPPLM